MKDKKDIAILKELWNLDVNEMPDTRTINTPLERHGTSPFPLSLQAQKTLLELIYERKSGIITRQELIDVLYNKKDDRPGKVYRSTL